MSVTTFTRLMILALLSLATMPAMPLGLRASSTEAYEAFDEPNDNRAKKEKLSACLPKDVRADDVVTYGRNRQPDVTVAQTLSRIKARCQKEKLVDAKKREIRFFRMSCWGHPPPNYQEIRRKENAELAALQKKYTVIVFGCNSTIN